MKESILATNHSNILTQPKKQNPPEIMKSSPAVNPNNQNKGSPSNPSDEKNDNPMGGTGNR